jgi:hypothetical protein
MWYFAYGSNLNARAVADWCRHHGKRLPNLRRGKPAILPNYRLCFPVYSTAWGGGIADIAYDPGKSVSGALFDLTDIEMRTLDEKVARRVDSNGRDIGAYCRLDINVLPLHRGEAVKAVTYQATLADRDHVPPTAFYMNLLVQGAYEHGLSMMWISYLKSFTTQRARKPSPPGYGDSAPRL